MIIICPNCDARYQLASASLGNAGRKVQCANCRSDWTAQPEPEPPVVEPVVAEPPVAASAKQAPPPQSDRIFSEEEEKKLDASFEDEQARIDQLAQELADGASDDLSKRDAEKFAAQRNNLLRRQQILTRNLPRARMRRIGRMVLAITLMTLLGSSLFSRDTIVRALPDTAWLFGVVGLATNVIGLEFNNIQTIRTVTDGVEQIEINGEVQNISGRQVAVPSVLVQLTNAQGNSIYRWTTQTREQAIGAGEWVYFSSTLSAPPAEAVGIRLSFVDDVITDRPSRGAEPTSGEPLTLAERLHN